MTVEQLEILKAEHSSRILAALVGNPSIYKRFFGKEHTEGTQPEDYRQHISELCADICDDNESLVFGSLDDFIKE